MAETLILLGTVTAPHGIKGEVKIRTYTEIPENITAYGPLTDKSGQKSFTVKIIRVSDDHLIARIDGITTRNDSEKLRGQELYVPRSRLPAPAESEYYIEDLVGLEVRTESGAIVGTILSVQDFGAGHIVETTASDDDKKMIAFNSDNFPVIDVAKGFVILSAQYEILHAEPDEN